MFYGICDAKRNAMIRRFYFIVLTAVLSVACSSVEKETPQPKEGELVLTASKTAIKALDNDTVVFKVTFEGKDITLNPRCVIKSSHADILSDPKFVSDSVGEYKFKAMYQGVVSNEVSIMVNVPIIWYSRNHCVFYTTSVNCAACPTGSAVVQQAKLLSELSILPLYFHGHYSGNDPFAIGVASMVQAWLYGPGFPTISVNNQGLLRNGWFGIEAFEPFMKAPKLTTSSAVAISTEFDKASRKMTCDIKASVTNPAYIGQDVRLVAFILEENLASPQMTPDGTDQNYVHNDVVRRPLIGTSIFGEQIKEQYIATNQEYTENIIFDIPKQWNDTELYVQAYLLHKKGGKTTKEDTVMNVCRVKLGSSADYQLME